MVVADNRKHKLVCGHVTVIIYNYLDINNSKLNIKTHEHIYTKKGNKEYELIRWNLSLVRLQHCNYTSRVELQSETFRTA